MFLGNVGIDLHDVSPLRQPQSAHFCGAHWTEKLFIKASERFSSDTFKRKKIATKKNYRNLRSTGNGASTNSMPFN